MAGIAPPVILMICWLLCGPRVKRENGIEIEMPCCRMKFELSNRKKASRKARSPTPLAKATRRYNLVVRLSFTVKILLLYRPQRDAPLTVKDPAVLRPRAESHQVVGN